VPEGSGFENDHEDYPEDGHKGEDSGDSGEEYYNRNFSKEIQKVFGKRRMPIYPESDDDMMEASFGTMEAEDRRSERLAHKEDMEEEVSERQRKRKKMALKKHNNTIQ
jgi:hypothetical protein